MITLPSQAKNAKKKVRLGKPVKASRASEVAYRKALQQLLKPQQTQAALLLRLMNNGATKQEASAALAENMTRSKKIFAQQSEQISNAMVDGLSAEHKQKTESMIARAFGVDWAYITDDPEVAGELLLRKTKNVSLIESIGSEYWGKISQAVEDSYAGTLKKPLINTIAEIGGVSERKAQVIARDQTAKTATSLNEVRQTSNGISEYDWSNSGDNRVVGKPGGLYPKGNRVHGDHWSRQGKRFKWNQPPHDGHPGQAVLCRCKAKPVLNIDELIAQFV